MKQTAASRRLAEALRALLARGHARPPLDDPDARLDYLERELGEMRTRINALFFAVLAVALGELVGRLVAA